MSWTAPRDWVAGEIVTASIMNTHVRDQLRYLKGLDGVVTTESGLIVDNTGGDEYIKLPLLSTAECATVLAAEGKLAHDEQTHRIKLYMGTDLVSLVSTADVSSTPTDGATTVPISSDYIYDHLNIMTAAGNILYATAPGVWDNLPMGTAGQFLRTNVATTAPEWATGVSSTIASSYVGNDAASRNITTGFMAEFVLINLTGSKQWFATRSPNVTTLVHKTTSPYHVEDATNCYVDATNGFVVSINGENSNATGVTYRYWAVG